VVIPRVKSTVEPLRATIVSMHSHVFVALGSGSAMPRALKVLTLQNIGVLKKVGAVQVDPAPNFINPLQVQVVAAS
jgi:hypothetical protein